jgi:hypothetical protein
MPGPLLPHEQDGHLPDAVQGGTAAASDARRQAVRCSTVMGGGVCVLAAGSTMTSLCHKGGISCGTCDMQVSWMPVMCDVLLRMYDLPCARCDVMTCHM